MSKNTFDICGCDLMIYKTINIYKNGNIIDEIETKKKWSRITYKKHNPIDTQFKISKLYKPMFDKCIEEIKNEVSYRPGKIMMIETQNHFYSLTTIRK
jgi:hypothetical protein